MLKSKSQINNNSFLILFTIVLSIVFGFTLSYVDPLLLLGLLFGAFLFIGIITNTKLFLGLLLIIRPLAEIVRDNTIFFGVNLAAIVTILVSSAILIRLAINKNTKIGKVDYSYFAYLVVSLIPIFYFAKSIFAGLSEWMRYLSFLLIFISVRNLRLNTREKNFLLKCILLSTIIPVAYGLYQVITHQGDLIIGVYRYKSFFAHQNVLGIFLAFTTPLWYLFIGQSRKHTRKLFYLIGFLFCTIMMYFTYARVAFVAFVLVFIYIAIKKKDTRIILALILSIGLLILISPDFVLRWIQIKDNSIYTNSMISRFLFWSNAWKEFLTNPIFGIGFRSFNISTASTNSLTLALQGIDFHNAFIQILTETGILGFAFYSISMLNITFFAIKVHLHEDTFNFIPIYFICYFIARFAISFVDNFISSPVIEWNFWVIAALTMNLFDEKKQENTSI